MSAFLVANFQVHDQDAYREYQKGVVPTLVSHGAKIHVADYDSEAVEGSPGAATIVIEFESKEALRAWYNSSEYQSIIKLRTDNSEGQMVFANGFEAPK